MFVSPYKKVGEIVWFLRMVDKIRLKESEQLPEEYLSYMGHGFDARCCKFLGIDYEALINEVRSGKGDRELLEWSFRKGNSPGEEEILVWNEFMVKRGWRDTDGDPDELADYKSKYGMGHRKDILTYFEFFEVDEGRKD